MFLFFMLRNFELPALHSPKTSTKNTQLFITSVFPFKVTWKAPKTQKKSTESFGDTTILHKQVCLFPASKHVLPQSL